MEERKLTKHERQMQTRLNARIGGYDSMVAYAKHANTHYDGMFTKPGSRNVRKKA